MAIAEAWFCAQGPMFVLFLRFVFGLLYGLEDPNMAHYTISNNLIISSQSLIDFLSVGI